MASASTCATSAVRLRERVVLKTGRASMSSRKIFFSKRSLMKTGRRGAITSGRAGAGANGSGCSSSQSSVTAGGGGLAGGAGGAAAPPPPPQERAPEKKEAGEERFF